MHSTVSCPICALRLPDRNHADTLSKRIPHIADALKKAQVTCVQIKYDGSFDGGGIQDPIYLKSNGVPAHAGISNAVHSELRVFFSELLEMRFPQWNNAEGAHGEIQWNLESDLVAHAHILRSPSHRPRVVTGL